MSTELERFRIRWQPCRRTVVATRLNRLTRPYTSLSSKARQACFACVVSRRCTQAAGAIPPPFLRSFRPKPATGRPGNWLAHSVLYGQSCRKRTTPIEREPLPPICPPPRSQAQAGPCPRACRSRLASTSWSRISSAIRAASNGRSKKLAHSRQAPRFACDTWSRARVT